MPYYTENSHPELVRQVIRRALQLAEVDMEKSDMLELTAEYLTTFYSEELKALGRTPRLYQDTWDRFSFGLYVELNRMTLGLIGSESPSPMKLESTPYTDLLLSVFEQSKLLTDEFRHLHSKPFLVAEDTSRTGSNSVGYLNPQGYGPVELITNRLRLIARQESNSERIHFPREKTALLPKFINMHVRSSLDALLVPFSEEHHSQISHALGMTVSIGDPYALWLKADAFWSMLTARVAQLPVYTGFFWVPKQQ